MKLLLVLPLALLLVIHFQTAICDDNTTEPPNSTDSAESRLKKPPSNGNKPKPAKGTSKPNRPPPSPASKPTTPKTTTKTTTTSTTRKPTTPKPTTQKPKTTQPPKNKTTTKPPKPTGKPTKPPTNSNSSVSATTPSPGTPTDQPPVTATEQPTGPGPEQTQPTTETPTDKPGVKPTSPPVVKPTPQPPVPPTDGSSTLRPAATLKPPGIDGTESPPIIIPVQPEDVEKPTIVEPVLPFDSVKDDHEMVCNVMGDTNLDSYKVSVGQFVYSDLFKMSLWNLQYNFKGNTTKAPFPSPSLKYKREVLSVIVDIFIKFCPEHFVNAGFLRVLKEVALIYQNSIGTIFPNNNGDAKWKKVLENLQKCKGQVSPPKFFSLGFIVNTFGDPKTEIKSPKEKADETYESMDLIMESMWWMFQTAFALCYSTPDKGRPNYAARFKQLFYLDFLHPLREKWKQSIAPKHFGPIVGDFDIAINQYNMRQCSTAAFMTKQLTDRQSVRPLTVNSTVLPVERIQNEILEGQFYTATEYLARYLIS